MRTKMKIGELAEICLGGYHNTYSVERPISPAEPNEIIFSGKFNSGLMPSEIREMEFYSFSVNNNNEHHLNADIVIYIEDLVYK